MHAAVVDASALAALVFAEADQAAIAARLTGRSLWAPRLLELELANIACSKIRRAEGAPGDLLANVAEADHLGITLVDPPVDDVLSLALATGLTAYDASYLWVAATLEIPLVTLDRQLARAANRAGRS